jgi:hypothetical protein
MQGASNATVASEALRALVQGDGAALDEHPGYWQARQYFPRLFAPFADMRVEEILRQICQDDRASHSRICCGVRLPPQMIVPTV